MSYFGENNWFRDDRGIFEMELSPYAITLRVFLAAVANSEGESWYSLDTMQQALSMGRHSLVKAVRELEGKHLLVVCRQRGRKVNLYRLLPVDPVRGAHCSEPAAVRQAHRSDDLVVRDAHCKWGVMVRHAHSNKNRERTIKISLERMNRLFPAECLSPEVPKDPERVLPVLREFHRCYVEFFGAEPPKAQFDWSRDGKRVKELPSSYTLEILMPLVPVFFDSPGYVTRGYRFQDFIEAIPRLMKGASPHGRGEHDSPATECRPSADFSDWG